jgi:hypothetical protein
MKTISALIFAFIITVVIADKVSAQSQMTPEFRLDIHYTDTSTHGEGFELHPVRALGYDPRAKDAYDPFFGEDGGQGDVSDSIYSGDIGGFPDVFFRYPNSDSGTRVDIRHKPNADSFSINYIMGLKFQFPAGHIYWDPRTVPQAVTAIWIRPLNRIDTVVADMKRDSIFKGLFGYGYVVTLFYNMVPQMLPLAVNSQPQDASLLSALSAYPNPIREQGKISVALSEPATLTITGFDETGRECIRQVDVLSNGVSMIPLQNIGALHGSILLHVEVTSASRSESRNILVVKN